MRRTEAFLEDLKALCAIDSGHRNAPGTRAMAEFFEKRFQTMGLQTEIRYDQGNDFAPFLVAHNAGLERIDALLVAHMDTVFPVGTAAARPMTVDADNIAHGPGCSDCKGGCLLIEYFLREIRRPDGTWPFSFCVALNSDEEKGSLYSRGYFEELAQRTEYCFIFEPGRANDEFVSVRKGGENYIVRCHGVSAHSGVNPQDGASAVLELARQALELDKLVDYGAGTSLNIGRFSGGGDSGAVPDYAEFTLSFRSLDPAAFDRLHAALNAMCAHPFDSRTRIEAERISSRPAMVMHPATKALVEELYAAGRQTGIPVEDISTGGGSDGNFISRFGVATLDGCGPCGAGLHTDGEYMKVDSIERRIALLGALFERLFGR